VSPGRSFVVGRDEGVDLQIIDAMVSRHHLLLQPAERGWQLVDQSRNGSFVNVKRAGRFCASSSRPSPLRSVRPIDASTRLAAAGSCRVRGRPGQYQMVFAGVSGPYTGTPAPNRSATLRYNSPD